MTATDEDRWLDIAALAALLGISRSAAYRLRRHLPSYRLPGVGLRFARADVEAWIATHRHDPAAVTASVRCAGMRVASPRRGGDDDQEVVPGMTRRRLKELAGF